MVENFLHKLPIMDYGSELMKLLSPFLASIASVCLAAVLIAGCIATPSQPKPPGVVQVWVEPSQVRVLHNGKTLSVIQPNMPRVEGWRLVENNNALVIKSRARPSSHAAVELFDIYTGQLKARVMTSELYTGQPAWARGFED